MLYEVITDFWGVVLCVAMMSISSLFYIIGGQWLISKVWHLVPISGYDGGLDAPRFLILPVILGIISGVITSYSIHYTKLYDKALKDAVN